jgi:glycerol-3-phosphate acyltransferase PlsY
MIIFQYVAAVLVGYILGSIPFGLLVAKRTAKVDVRAYGSGKTGATNVLRTAGRKAAAMVAAMDLLKGALAVIFAGLIVGKSYLIVGNFGLGSLLAQVLAALAAVAGHNWSVFLKFRGGSGVATFFGGMIAMCPWVVAIFGGQILVLGAGLTGFVSLGSIAGVVGTYAILVPLTVLNGFPIEYLIYALLGAFMIIIMHRGNIVRLLRGKERRLGEKVEDLQVPPS